MPAKRRPRPQPKATASLQNQVVKRQNGRRRTSAILYILARPQTENAQGPPQTSLRGGDDDRQTPEGVLERTGVLREKTFALYQARPQIQCIRLRTEAEGEYQWLSLAVMSLCDLVRYRYNLSVANTLAVYNSPPASLCDIVCRLRACPYTPGIIW